MTFERGPEPRQQRIEHRRMVEIVGGAGELKCARIEQPHCLQRGRRFAGVLNLRDIGDVRQLVKTLGDVLACRAYDRGEHEQAEDRRGDKRIAGRAGRQLARLSICTGAGHEGQKCAERG